MTLSLSVQEQTTPVLTRHEVTGPRRGSMLPHYFSLYMMVFENRLYNQMSKLVAQYNGAYWNMYELSNGGFYMSPRVSGLLTVEAPNQFTGQLSADAAGITACLYVYSEMSFAVTNEAMRQTLTKLFHNLREWALDHEESALILAAID